MQSNMRGGECVCAIGKYMVNYNQTRLIFIKSNDNDNNTVIHHKGEA